MLADGDKAVEPIWQLREASIGWGMIADAINRTEVRKNTGDAKSLTPTNRRPINSSSLRPGVRVEQEPEPTKSERFGYRVPCIRGKWTTVGPHWSPVNGPLHDDAQFLDFPWSTTGISITAS